MRTHKRTLTALSTVAVLAAAGLCRMDSPASANPLPCNANTTLTVYVPSSSTHGTLMLEDQWPGYGDLDFNDAVITYQYALAYNSSGNLVQLVATYNVLAAGNGRDNGFALALPIPRANVGSVTLQQGNGAPAALAPRAAEANLVVDVLANTKSAFNAVGDGHQINTDPSQSVLPGTTYQLVVSLSTPTLLSAATAPFDAFFYWSQTPGHEIHRPFYAGSASMDASLFNTLQDGSTAQRHFVDDRGIPYVLDVPAVPRWSRESVDISSGYAQLAAFGQSGGASNQSWYQSPSNATLFTSGQGGSLPPSPSFIGGSGAYSIDGTCNLCISNNVTCPAAPDQCHDQGTCAPATGVCSAAPAKANGTPCNDGNANTSNDVCTNGVCAGTAATCNDGIQNQGESGVDCGGPCAACGVVGPAFGLNNTLLYNGYYYATLDDSPVNSASVGCQSFFVGMPSGWQFAPEDASVVANVIQPHGWGTHCVLFDNTGVSYGGTNWGVGNCGCSGSACINQSGSSYMVTSCSRRILIRRPVNGAALPAGCAHASDGTVWCATQTLTQTGSQICGYPDGYAGPYYAITAAGAAALGRSITSYGDCATNYFNNNGGITGWNGDGCWTPAMEWGRSGQNTLGLSLGGNVVRCTNLE